jgi:uncharacterized protein DUF4365
MEQLQEGYVAAVAATAGCAAEFTRRDLYGIDAQIIRGRTSEQGDDVAINIQLKSTTTVKPDQNKGWFSYQFQKRKYFTDLSKMRPTIKTILVVMVTTPVQTEWSKATHDSLQVQHCCYWRSLEGETAREGVQSPSVRIPISNIFDATALTGIMDKIDRGESLQ